MNLQNRNYIGMNSLLKFYIVRPQIHQLQGLIGSRIHLTINRNLFFLNFDCDFLKPFREKNEIGTYVGLGKTLDGLVRFNYYFPSPRLSELQKKCFDILIKSQLEDGYIGMYLPEARYSKLWDLHEVSYLILSIVSNYMFNGDQCLLNAAIKAADDILNNLTAEVITELYHTKSDSTAVCIELCSLGFERAFLELFKATGNKKYLDAVGTFGLNEWNRDIVLTRKDGVEGHAYAYLYRCLTQLELYELTGNKRLLQQTERVMDFLLHEGGMVVTGACGVDECWHNDQAGIGDMGETCATAYYLRVLAKLLQIYGDCKYGDVMERVIYNALFAAQSPDGRQLRYYSPFEGDRTYWPLDTYCCPNNYRRIIAELPEMIYFCSIDGVLINLYNESEISFKLTTGEKITIKQITAYPEQEKVTIRLIQEKATSFVLYLRIPKWSNNFVIKYNGEPTDNYSYKKGMVAIDKIWRPEDEIAINFDMRFRQVKGFFKQDGKVAVMRGPLLFCFNPKHNPDIHLDDLNSWFIDPETFSDVVVDYIRPKAIACRVKAYKNEKSQYILLTEFPDPDGKATYFNSLHLEKSDDDELIELKDFDL